VSEYVLELLDLPEEEDPFRALEMDQERPREKTEDHQFNDPQNDKVNGSSSLSHLLSALHSASFPWHLPPGPLDRLGQAGGGNPALKVTRLTKMTSIEL